jgi:hypothetical protein
LSDFQAQKNGPERLGLNVGHPGLNAKEGILRKKMLVWLSIFVSLGILWGSVQVKFPGNMLG